MLVFAMIIMFLTFLGLGVKFSRWGKNPPGGHKRDSKMCCVQLLRSTIQLLCINVPETLLHVTLKGLAEISAGIFARFLQYFCVSCKNFPITFSINVLNYKRYKNCRKQCEIH